MLETLHTVPWHNLSHAYGSATDVPRLLLALASPDKEVRERAVGRLWSNVTHQGTIYNVTPYVVPFFCELVENPDVQDRHELLFYLTGIARGSSYLDVHKRKPEERADPEIQKQMAEELSWVEATKSAVSAGYASYLRLLNDPDPLVRESAAHTLAYCPQHAQQVIPLMQEHYFKYQEKLAVRASLILSLGHLLPQNTESSHFFDNVLRVERNPFLQVAIAIGSTYCLREQTSREALDILLQSFELPRSIKKLFEALTFAGDNQNTCVTKALRNIGLSIAPVVIPALMKNLARNDASSAYTFVNHFLFFVMDGKKITRNMTVTDISDVQKKALALIYKTPHIWKYGNMSYSIGNYFDPVYEGSDYLSWYRDDVEAFLAGAKVSRPRPRRTFE